MTADLNSCFQTACIHPTAIIHPNAQVDPTVSIGPYCVIGKDVVLKSGVKLFSHVIIEGQTTIEEDCSVYPFAYLGGPAQYLGDKEAVSQVRVGARTIIREHVTIHSASGKGSGITSIGKDCFLMTGSHIAHDCQVGDRVIMANHATLAGHVCVEDDVFLGGLCAIHQWGHIGRGAMVCGLSGVAGGVIPLTIVYGPRAILKSLNYKKIQTLSICPIEVHALEKAFLHLFPKKTNIPLVKRLESLPENLKNFSWINRMCTFIEAQLCNPQKRPLCLRAI